MLTHPEKLLFPDDGITKGELAAYYQTVKDLILPHLRGRPVTMERYPAGIGGKGFIQKDVAKGFPAWLARVEVPRRSGKSEGPVHYPLIDDERALCWLTNQNCITPHVWSSRLPELDRPDLCVFDLDPSLNDPEQLRSAALALRDVLGELGFTSLVKTSGAKGFHVVLALDESSTFEAAWRFAQGVGRVLVKRYPWLFTQEFIKADRGERILIDTGRNARGATFAAPYAVRAKPGAPVSAPCSWAEVESGAALPQTFRLRSMAARVAELGDPWRNLAAVPASLRDPLTTLEAWLGAEDWQEAVHASTRRRTSRRRRPKA